MLRNNKIYQAGSKNYFKTESKFLVIQSDLFGMFKWPFQGVKWPPTRGWKGHFESPGWWSIMIYCTRPLVWFLSAWLCTDSTMGFITIFSPPPCGDVFVFFSNHKQANLSAWYIYLGCALVISHSWAAKRKTWNSVLFMTSKWGEGWGCFAPSSYLHLLDFLWKMWINVGNYTSPIECLWQGICHTWIRENTIHASHVFGMEQLRTTCKLT